MEQLVQSTAQNLSKFALEQFDELDKVFPDVTPEEYFELLIKKLESFLDAAENSEYLEDMEDALAAVVGAAIGISVKSGLFTEEIDAQS